ncbi:MAG: SlyX family protein [Desulfovibrionaceae bacterium]|nr:SlyX family protein [Desulfovibrionaceae bacterium]
MAHILDRLQRVEENQYFQEQLVEELNALVVSQQAEIASLKRDLDGALQKLQDIVQLIDLHFANTKPPHYAEKI